MSKSKRRAENSAERKATILAATLQQITEKGLHNTTIADICQQSGASVGSIYHHFGDREGVMYALYHDCFVECFGRLRTVVLASTTAHEGITTLVHTYLNWVVENTDKANFIYEASQGNLLSNNRDDLLAFKNSFYTDMFTWMQPFIAAGELIALPPWAYDAIIMGPAHEFSRRWLGGMRDLPMEEAQTIIADAVWRAIQTS